MFKLFFISHGLFQRFILQKKKIKIKIREKFIRSIFVHYDLRFIYSFEESKLIN